MRCSLLCNDPNPPLRGRTTHAAEEHAAQPGWTRLPAPARPRAEHSVPRFSYQADPNTSWHGGIIVLDEAVFQTFNGIVSNLYPFLALAGLI